MNMKKLATAFAAIACIMGSASVFAKAPVISGVPDLVIGDRDDSLTVDSNWFRYANAINILDYVTDIDSPDSDLLFTFVEQTTAKDLGIRVESANATVLQLDAVDSATVVADWTGHEITNYGGTRDYLLTFVDLIRSPEPYGNGGAAYPDPAKVGGGTAAETEQVDLGWHNTEGSGSLQDASRMVWIYVADDPLADGANRVDNDAISVISRNYGYDDATGGNSALFSDGFANGAGTSGAAAIWVSSTFTGMTACTLGSGSGTTGANGYISLASATATTNGFSRWLLQNNVAPAGGAAYTPYVGAIPYVTPGPGESLIYCARFTMSQSQTDQGSAPQIRFGAAHVTYLTEDLYSLLPAAGSAAQYNVQTPALGSTATYKSVWSANEGSPDFAKLDHSATIAGLDMRGYNLFFDVFDVGAAQGGTWTLSNVDVVTTPRPADTTAAVTETDFRSSNGWTLDASAFTTITAAWDGTGKMTITDTGTPRAAGTFPYRLWSKAISRAAVAWDSNQLLRFKMSVQVPNVSDRAGFHWLRLRQKTRFYNVNHETSIQGGDGNIVIQTIGGYPFVPTTTAYVYESYMSSQVSDANFDWAPIRAVNGDEYTMFLDTVGLAPRPGGTTGSELATHYTINSLSVESFADPF
jgi:hypothetical protein